MSLNNIARDMIPPSKILIFDPDPSAEISIGEKLKEDGHSYKYVSDWESAKSLLENTSVDVVLLSQAISSPPLQEVAINIKKIRSRIRLILLVDGMGVSETRELLRLLPVQGCHDKQHGIDRLGVWLDVVLKFLPKLDLLRSQVGTIKSQIKTIERNKEGLRWIIKSMPETINRLQPLDKFVRGILIQITGFIDADSSFFATVDSNNELVLLVGTGAFDVDERSFHKLVIDSPHKEAIGKVFSSKKEYLIDEKKLYLPLCSEDKVIGIVYAEKAEELQGLEQEMLRLFATQSAVTIENSNLFRLATVDSLTGLFVRRYFLQRFQEVLQFASRYGKQSVSLLMFDIDHFKKVNDTYGHASGDVVLSGVSEIILNSIRSTDVAGRLGGEEFAVLLVDTGEEKAVSIAQAIREKVKSTVFQVEGGVDLSVTASIGVAFFTSYAINTESLKSHPLQAVVKHDIRNLLNTADQALYESKENGRDRVTVANEVIPGFES